jgi:hypothetical protein
LIVVIRDDYYEGEEDFFGIIVLGNVEIRGYCIVSGGIVIIGVISICWRGLMCFAPSHCG